MNIQIRGCGTAIEFRRLTEEQCCYWVNAGDAALKMHLDGDQGDCLDAYAVTSIYTAERSSIVGPCPYSAMMYVTGDADGDLKIDLADIIHDYPGQLIHCREAYPDPVTHLQRTRELEGTFCEADFGGEEFIWEKLLIGMTYCDGAYMIDQVQYDGVPIDIAMPDVTTDKINIKNHNSEMKINFT